MKSGVKSIRNLLVPALILLILIASFVVVYYLASKDTTAVSETTKEEPEYIISISPDDINSLSVTKNDGEGYTISRREFSSSGQRWLFAGEETNACEKFCSDTQIEAYLFDVGTIACLESFSVDEGALSEYGLEDPVYTVDYSTEKGDSIRLEIGTRAIGENSVYARIDSAGLIYVISTEKSDAFDVSEIYFWDRRALNFSDESIRSFRFERKTDQLVLVAGPGTELPTLDQNVKWDLIEPISFRGGDDLDRLATGALSLEIDEYVSRAADDRSQYGLDAPEYIFSVENYDGRMVKIYLSREMAGKYYGYSDSIPGIFRISASKIRLLDSPLIDFCAPYPIHTSIDEVRSIKAIFPEGEFEIELDVEEDMSLSHQDASIYVNQRSAKVVDQYNRYYFMALFDSIMGIKFDRVEPSTYSEGDAEISLRIITKDKVITTVAFTECENGAYQVSIDGRYIGLVVSSDELYAQDLDDPGVWFAYELLRDALDGQINGKYDIPVSR